MINIQKQERHTKDFLSQAQYSEQAIKVLKDTYQLLSLTLMVSAATALMAYLFNFQHLWLFNSGTGALLSFGIMMGLIIGIQATANSSMGIVLTFAFAAFEGLFLGSLIAVYTAAEGAGVVVSALAGTAAIFFTLSTYAQTSGKDFSMYRGLAFGALVAIVVLALANIFLGISWLSTAISVAVLALFSFFILQDTADVLHGYQTNYIRATISMYLNLVNVFTSLLHLIGLAND